MEAIDFMIKAAFALYIGVNAVRALELILELFWQKKQKKHDPAGA